MDGIIIVNKPQGWTSFDVVAKIRGLTKVKKVGHSGTLDPMATGVLPVFLGKATKSINQYLNGDKGYEGEMVLGVRTDSGDADGKVIMTNDECLMTNEGIIQIFKKYVGEIEQVPPMYSAVKINGQRLYELARKGIEVERKARKVTIYKLDLLDIGSMDLGVDARMEVGNKKLEVGLENPISNGQFQPPCRLPHPTTVSFSVLCSKGTYIRQLAMDIGDDLGCGAHLSKLVRTYSHPFHLSQALEMETIINLAKIGKLETIVVPV